MSNREFRSYLSEKELNGLNTRRLNELRKRINPTLGKLRLLEGQNALTESDFNQLRKLSRYHASIKNILDKREHLEK